MLNERYAYLLVSDERWWMQLCGRNRNQEKINVFVRRGRVGPLKARKLFFYIAKPVMQICGVADFVERLAGNYKVLWNARGDETCLRNFREYIDFLEGRKTATFIRFTSFRELQNPIPLERLIRVLGILRVPRGGKYLNRETAEQLTV